MGPPKPLRGKTEKLAIDDVIIDIVNDDEIERHFRLVVIRRIYMNIHEP